MSQNSISEKLEKSRKELLDLGLRNPLLNYRTKARGLEAVRESPVSVFRILVLEGKTMSFTATKEKSSDGLLEQPEELTEEERQALYDDLRLQTPYDSAALQSRLLTTYRIAHTLIEEQGVNTLYLALGMLRWYEAESSQEVRRAPLILIPVELERANAKERFHLSYTGEEIGANLSLAAKLKSEFGLDLPSFPESNDDLDVPTYFTALEKVIESQPRWSVERDTIVLNLFSFAKFLMFRDLDEEIWPDDSQPSNHLLVKALLHDGFCEAPLTITEEDHLDQHLQPLDLNQVVDADSSQVLAMLAVSQNRNLIIQGPPGTGKSQTITNMIAEAIEKGKKVLFVAEKMAALDVVKRRLDKIGLGDACLELHSHNTNKKALLGELAHTLNLGKPLLKSIEAQISLFAEVRNKLNNYCEAVNTAIGESGVTPYDAYGEMLKLRRLCNEVKLPQLNLPEMTLWNSTDYQRKRAIVAEMQHRLKPIGSLRAHPFRGSRIKVLMPTEQERLEDLCLIAWQATARVRDKGNGLANLLGLPMPQVIREIEVLSRAAQRAMNAPSLHGIQLRTGDWQSRRDEIQTLITAGLRLSQLHKYFDPILIPEAWEQDILETRQHLINYGNKWWRFLSSDYRKAKNRLAGLCKVEAPKEIKQKIELVDAVLEARRQQLIVREFQSLGMALFGAQWQGEKSDWQVLAKLFEWIIALYKEIGDGHLPEGILIFLAGNPRVEGLEATIVEVETALKIHAQRAQELASALDLDEQSRFGQNAGVADQSLEVQERLFDEWSAQLPRLHEIAAFNLQSDILRQEGLTELLRVIENWPDASQHLVSAFEWNWFEKLLTKAFLERPVLAAFQGESQSQAVNQFCQLDRLLTEHNRLRLAHTHWQRLPEQSGGGQMGILLRELVKKSRHLPIRKLMREAGNAIQAIKPVFMMSPLSIANYLAPDSINFDLVIFDEASQVKPVDAFGAILRGQQIVVVGDSKQMPPTSFFDTLIQGGDGDEEDDSSTANIESILGLCKAQGMPERMLRWHYRSRHESLIAVSNYEFYENRLIVFPSNDHQDGHLGLVYHHLPQTVYDKGKSTTNAQEAVAVAQAVMDFARAQLRCPTEKRQSLLVAAFSMAQTRAIADRLEMLRRQDTSCEEFFNPGRYEPFEVKNLESVQGDERDVIFISIGYGRDETGQVSMNFGPLNRDGGERRLNVLITRARRRCEIFTNLTDQDIDLSRTNSRGVRALKSFLAYARTKQLDTPQETGRGTDSPFEDEVKAALEAQGYEVRTQVGSAGFFIDLAIVDPKKPGAYLLGIECDGAMYHSSRSARDRDRLRQQVLEGLGWHIHRIWSTDWFRHPAQELKRVVNAINEAETKGATNTIAFESLESSTPIERAIELESQHESSIIQPYQMANFSIDLQGYELHTVRRDLLSSWIIEVVKVESPIHISEVARRITTAAGIARAGNRIKDAIESACAYAMRMGEVRRQGAFLWAKDMAQPLIRERSDLPASSRKIDLIAPEEMIVVVEHVVKRSLGIQRESICLEVARTIGFSRTTDEMQIAIDALVDRLLASGHLKQAGTHIVHE